MLGDWEGNMRETTLSKVVFPSAGGNADRAGTGTLRTSKPWRLSDNRGAQVSKLLATWE